MRSNRIEQHIKNIREAEKNSEYSLFIARDDYEYDEYDEHFSAPGKLHIFYDRPQLELDPVDNHMRFTNARMIGEIPSYMYPNIEECSYLEFTYKPIQLEL